MVGKATFSKDSRFCNAGKTHTCGFTPDPSRNQEGNRTTAPSKFSKICLVVRSNNKLQSFFPSKNISWLQPCSTLKTNQSTEKNPSYTPNQSTKASPKQSVHHRPNKSRAAWSKHWHAGRMRPANTFHVPYTSQNRKHCISHTLLAISHTSLRCSSIRKYFGETISFYDLRRWNS